MNIGGIEIGAGQPCRFVAEISNNHNGSLTRALWLVDAAAEAGADFVKFQCYTPAELIALRGDGPAPDPWGASGWTMASLYEKARTPLEWFPKLFTYARSRGIVPFASVFGEESFRALHALDCPAYKIAALDRRNLRLRSLARLAGKPVLVSTADFDQLGMGLDQEAVLYCPPGYPTPAAGVHLPHTFVGGLPVENWHSTAYLGLSTHCLAPELPIAAVARGCKLIEMHFQSSAMRSALEAEVSLTETQFAAMVQAVRATEALLA